MRDNQANIVNHWREEQSFAELIVKKHCCTSLSEKSSNISSTLVERAIYLSLIMAWRQFRPMTWSSPKIDFICGTWRFEKCGIFIFNNKQTNQLFQVDTNWASNIKGIHRDHCFANLVLRIPECSRWCPKRLSLFNLHNYKFKYLFLIRENKYQKSDQQFAYKGLESKDIEFERNHTNFGQGGEQILPGRGFCR